MDKKDARVKAQRLKGLINNLKDARDWPETNKRSGAILSFVNEDPEDNLFALFIGSFEVAYAVFKMAYDNGATDMATWHPGAQRFISALTGLLLTQFKEHPVEARSLLRHMKSSSWGGNDDEVKETWIGWIILNLEQNNLSF